jgi:hypothetical protein
MPRLALGVGLIGLLGCSGMAEGVIELFTGTSIDQEGDDVVMTNADGSTQRISQGEGTALPEGFPLPPPPEGTLDSVVKSEGGAANNTVVSFRLDEDANIDRIVAFYVDWFASEGLPVDSETKNLAGMRTTAMAATRGGDVYAVTLTDALGTRMLMLSYTPR